MKRILVAVSGRANWGSVRSVCEHLQDRDDCELTVMAYAGAVLPRYGEVAEHIEAEGYDVLRVPCLVEGGEPQHMVHTASLTLSACARVFETEQPDIVYVVGDRYEVLPVAQAAAYMNIPIAHQMGGEVSGTIDESIRHAITKLSHVHFVATDAARNRVVAMGEDPSMVFKTGCPRLDIMSQYARQVADHQPILLSQHPVTSEWEASYEQMKLTLEALERVQPNHICLFWPPSDAGCEGIVRALREMPMSLLAITKTYRSLDPGVYMAFMAQAACVVGNSSSAIREGSYLGVPVVNIGTRQQHRERDENVIDVGHDATQIESAIVRQLEHGPYKPSCRYGNGKAGERIAQYLMDLGRINPQKAWVGR